MQSSLRVLLANSQQEQSGKARKRFSPDVHDHILRQVPRELQHRVNS